MASETGKDPDPVPNPGGLRAALGRCGRIALAATKQLHDTGPRGTEQERGFLSGRWGKGRGGLHEEVFLEEQKGGAERSQR